MSKKNTKVQNQEFITPERLEQLLQYDIPYYGYINYDNGVKLYIETSVSSDLFVADNNHTDYFCSSKIVNVHILHVLYTVRSKDTLTSIAKRTGRTVEEIIKTNGLDNSGHIRAGDELQIDLDLNYGYEVRMFLMPVDQSEKYIKHTDYKTISGTDFFKYSSLSYSIVDNFGGSLASNAGKTQFGYYKQKPLKFKIYFENPNTGGVFRGNKYVKTTSLREIGTKIKGGTVPNIGKVAMPLVLIFEGVEIYDGVRLDGNTFGHNAKRATTGSAFSLAGAAAGAKAGALFGTWIGAPFGGATAIPAAIVLGFVGGVFGGIYGREAGFWIYDEMPDSYQPDFIDTRDPLRIPLDKFRDKTRVEVPNKYQFFE